MARKVVMPESDDKNGIKKKKGLNKCCTCLLVFGIVVLVILGIAFGVGWYFGDKYCKEYLDMPLGDAVGVVNKLYWADDGKVVSNPYSDEDLDKFYGEIKQNILLKTDAEVDFDAALNTALDNFMKKDGANAVNPANAASDGSGADGADDGNVMDIFVDMLADVFIRENIDTERLMEWKPENDNYIFHLNDKQLAAFVNSVLSTLLKNAENMESLSQFSGMVDIKNVVALKQIKFTAVSAPDEQNVEHITATTADVTVWLGLQDAAGQALSKLVTDAGAGWTSGLVTFVGNVLLPKNLYANISLPLHGDAKPTISLNDMNSGERANMYKLVDGIMSLTGGDMSIDGLLADIADQIKPFIEKVSDKMDFSSVSEGTITMDLLGSMADMAAGDATEGEALTKADFMYMLQAVIGSSPDNALAELEPHLYSGWYEGHNGELTRTETDSPVDYETAFVEEIENKYALNVPTTDGKKDLDSVLKMLNISVGNTGSGELDIMHSVKSDRLRALALSDDNVALKINDRMLGAILSDQVGNLGGNGSFDNISFELEAVSILSDEARPDHTYMLLAVRMGLSAMFDSLGSDNMLGKLVKNVVSDHMLIQFTVDISDTVSGMPSEQLDASKFRINDCANSDSVINSLAKLVDGLDLDKVAGDVTKNLTDMLKTLSDKFDIRFVTYDAATKTQGAIELPDVFTVISKLALTENDVPVLSGAELKTTLRVLYDDDVAAVGVAPGANYNAFTAEIKDKYYLNPGASDDISTFDGLAAFLASGSGDSFDGTKFLVKAERDNSGALLPLDPNRKYMAYDTRGIAELKPTMTPADLGALIKSETNGNTALESFEIVQVGSADNTLYIMLQADLASLLSGNDVADILDIERLFVTATVKTDAASVTEYSDGRRGYPVSIKINNADSADPDSDYALIIKLIKHFDDGNSFNIEDQVAEVGITLYEQIDNMQSSLGGGDDFMTFTDKGLQIGGFYEFLTNKLWGDKADKPSAEDVKDVIQAMYERHADHPDNTNNYVKADFIKNYSEAAGITYDEFIAQQTVTKTDYEFNGLLYQTVQAMSEQQNGVYAQQTIALSAANQTPEAQGIRTWIGERVEAVMNNNVHYTDATEYLLVTFEMNMKEFMNNSDMAKGFMPDVVYATIVFEKTRGTRDVEILGTTTSMEVDVFDNIGTVFNDMTPDKYKLLVDLMGLNTPELSEDDRKNTVNIETVTEESEKVLNDICLTGSMTFGQNASADPGIGTLTYVRRSPSV